MSEKKLTYLAAGIFIAILSVYAGKISIAQTTPSLLMSWRAEAYTPPTFAGKTLAPKGGAVTAFADLLVSGKISDLSQRNVRWFINGELYRSGRNLRRFTFSVPIQATGKISVKAVVDTPSGNVEQTILIPVGSPVVGISVSSIGGYVERREVTASAVPYFFSIQSPNELSYRWSANGVLAAGNENGNVVTLDTSTGAPGNSLLLGVHALNLSAAIESAQGSAIFHLR